MQEMQKRGKNLAFLLRDFQWDTMMGNCYFHRKIEAGLQ